MRRISGFIALTCLVMVAPGCFVPNVPPVAAFSWAASYLEVHFEASSSYDSDGTIEEYVWSFGDGGSSSGVTVDHTYSTAGTYTAQLTVTDNKGGTDHKILSITVTSPPPPISHRVTAGQIIDEYNENEVAADLKYKGKLVAVTGYVDNITNSSTDEPCVWLSRSQEWEIFAFTVNCYFRSSHQPAVAQLRDGQLITVVGIGHGAGFFSVKLRECYIE